jgi:hypothetical protein
MATFVKFDEASGRYWSQDRGWTSLKLCDKYTPREVEVMVAQDSTIYRYLQLWQCQELQFARLIVELDQLDVYDKYMDDLADAMDLDEAEVVEIVDAAKTYYDDIVRGI